MDREFDGKVALVTGAASGIGAAVARLLGARGARVVVADLNGAGAAEVAQAIAAAGGKAAPHVVDMGVPDQVEAMVRFAEERFGALHLAVNNAGISGGAHPTAEYPLDTWAKVIDINLNSVFWSMRAEIPAMRRAGGGAIVNMASILGQVGFAGAPAYVAAKHGVVGLTKAAALDHAAEGIRVTAVGPAFIDTPLLADMDRAAYDQLIALHPAGRLGRAEEVAEVTAFLLSDRASFTNGGYYPVDGGYLAR